MKTTKQIKTAKDFELGTPVVLTYGNREVSGEVVTRNGIQCISLYKDDNYSGDSERIVTPEWNKVKSFYTNQKSK